MQKLLAVLGLQGNQGDQMDGKVNYMSSLWLRLSFSSAEAQLKLDPPVWLILRPGNYSTCIWITEQLAVWDRG